MAPSGFPRSTTVKTNSSSWSTTSGGRIRQPNVRASATLPSPAEAQGNFQGLHRLLRGITGSPSTIRQPETPTDLEDSPFPTTRFLRQNSLAVPALLKYFGVTARIGADLYATASVVSNYSYSTLGTTGSPGPDSPWRLQSSPRNRSFPSATARRTKTPHLDRLAGAGSKILTQYYQYMGSNT